MGAPVASSYTQSRFRFRNDDGSQTAATWKAAENTNTTVVVDQVFRLRIQVAQTVTDANQDLTKAFKVRFSRNNGAYTDVAAIGATTAGVRYASSANVSDGTATTSQLTAASGTFLAGQIDNNNATGTLAFNIQQYTDLEFVLELYGPQLAVDDTLDFRVYETADVALNTYTQTARATALFYLAPHAPTLLSPEDASGIDPAQAQTFSWQFNSPESGDSQTAFAFRRGSMPIPLTGQTAVPSPYIGSTVYQFSYSTDESLLFISDNSAFRFKAFDSSTWADVTSSFPTPTGTIIRASLSHDSSLFAFGTNETPFVYIYDVANSYALVTGTPVPPEYPAEIVFSPTSSLLVVRLFTGADKIRVYDTTTWNRVTAAPVVDEVSYGILVSPDGSRFTVIGNNVVYMYNMTDWSFLWSSSVGEYPRHLAFSNDSSMLCVGYIDTTQFRLFNTTTGSEISGFPGTYPGGGNGVYPRFIHNDTYLFLGHSSATTDGNRRYTFLRVSDWSIIADAPQPLSIGTLRGAAALSSQPQLAYVLGGRSEFYVVGDGIQHTYWNGTDWQAEEIFVQSSDPQVVFPANAWEPPA